ncbi:MAG: hypothetical protein UCJ19_12765 [Oscillospiraceae bacterium]|nr:hypothetical protein [Oscillospiraceae bacterium]
MKGSSRIRRSFGRGGKSDRDSMRTAYERARAGSTKIYAVWPGNWSSDLFLIDDLDAFTEKWELV